VNPMTPVLAMSREWFVSPVTWHDTWPGLIAIIVTSAVLAAVTWSSLRRLSRGAR
jgi:ABC-type polysaccharide/polyol phosphate export permease